MSAQARFLLFGRVECRLDDAVVPLGRPRERCLLGLLLLGAGEPVPVDRLIDLLWHDGDPPRDPRASLHTYVSRLRRALDAAGVTLPATRGGYLADVRPDQVDVHQFRALLAAARGLTEPGARAAALQQVLDLRRGPLLGDVASDRLRRVLAADLDELHLAALDEYLDLQLALGRHASLLGRLTALVTEHPTREGLTLRLMLALYRSGRQAEALDAYHRLRERLVDLLAIEPGPDVAELYTAILRGDPELAAPSSGAAPDGPGGTDVRPAPVTAYRQLPPDLTGFVGRAAELGLLHDVLGGAAADATGPGVVAIEGMAGVGKTRLAVRFAHELVRSGGFDLQLAVDLHGYADEPPAEPAGVLRSFLHLLGVPAPQQPDDVNALAALYRDKLHGHRALVLLDNAASHRQVAPLLPASPASIVLVTSRRTLAIDGAQPLPIDVFTPEEAAELLTSIAGAHRVAADSAAARRVAELCGHLPVALTLAARRLRSRPSWGLPDIATRLLDREQRLAELAIGDRQITAVFDLSFQALDAAHQRLFRLLGLHPATDFTAESVAALAGCPTGQARRMLDRLVDEYLVLQATHDRYRLHDLLRDYARALPGEGADTTAVESLLVWCLYAVEAATTVLFPQKRDVELDPAGRPSHPPVFPDEECAFQWLDAEHALLVTVVGEAYRRGRYDIAWQLPALLQQYFEGYSRVPDWISTGRTALLAARRGGERHAEALILNMLGLAYSEAGQTDRAIDHINQSLEIRRALGDRLGEARSLNNLGVACGRDDRMPEAVEHLTAALAIRRELGSVYERAMTLTNLAIAYGATGRHEDAIRCLEQALDVRTRLADWPGVALVLHNMGEALLRVGRHDAAIARLREAYGIQRDQHRRGSAAGTLEILGQALLAAGDLASAQECWRESIHEFEALAHPRAETVRRLLADSISGASRQSR